MERLRLKCQTEFEGLRIMERFLLNNICYPSISQQNFAQSYLMFTTVATLRMLFYLI
jgi:hypothetical protein